MKMCLSEINKENRSSKLKVISGGGDGTTSWVLKSLVENKIDLNLCIIIPFPFGTGNDFSNALGWGVNVPKSLTNN